MKKPLNASKTSLRSIRKKPRAALLYNPRSDLTSFEKQVELQAAHYFSENLATLIRKYCLRFKHIIDRNSAQELFEPYALNRESRQALSLATHEPAGALSDAVFFSLVTKRAPTKKNIVLFNAGGQGSGKSTSLQHSDKVAQAFIVMDGTMQDFDKSCRNIDLAFTWNKMVHINFVYCPFRKAVENIIRRASDKNGGRVVQIGRAAKGHFQALENFFTLVSKYQKNNGFSYSIVDNSVKSAKLMSLEDLHTKRYPSIDALELEGYNIVDDHFASYKESDESLTDTLYRCLKSH